jgi:hypothetical protein
MTKKNLLTPLTLAAVLMAGACAEPEPAGDPDLLPAYDKETGRLQKLSYDSNGDGVIETWGYMDGSRVVRVEGDENQDGKIDRWEYHRRDATPGKSADPLETVERVERSTRHDGKVSRREFFEKGVLKRVEEDTDGDGQVDKWETYLNGSLSSMALDTLGRGQRERTLYYKPDGSLDRIEVEEKQALQAREPGTKD